MNRDLNRVFLEHSYFGAFVEDCVFFVCHKTIKQYCYREEVLLQKNPTLSELQVHLKLCLTPVFSVLTADSAKFVVNAPRKRNNKCKQSHHCHL